MERDVQLLGIVSQNIRTRNWVNWTSWVSAHTLTDPGEYLIATGAINGLVRINDRDFRLVLEERFLLAIALSIRGWIRRTRLVRLCRMTEVGS